MTEIGVQTAPAAEVTSGRTRLFNRDFVLLWQGQLVSQIGNQLHAVALMFWIKHATGSAGLMGLVLMFSMLPGVIIGPLGGTLADRYARRTILVVCDLLRGLGVIALAALLFLVPGQTGFLIAALFAISIALGILSALFGPALSAALPDLVPREKIAAANSINQSSAQVSLFAGQAAGGILFRLLGASALFLADGISYILSAVSLMFVRIPQRLPEAVRKPGEIVAAFRRDTAEGFRYVWRNRGLRALFFAAAFLNFFLAPIGVLLPFYVEDHLKARPDWFGFLLAALGVGSLAGYALAGIVRVKGRTRTAAMVVFLFLLALDFGVLGLARSTFAALAVTFLAGLLAGAVNIHIVTILQLTTPGEIRGRVFGLLSTLSSGLVPIGMGLAGVVADLLHRNIPLIYMISGGLAAICALVVSLSPDFRAYVATDPDTAAAQATAPARSGRP